MGYYTDHIIQVHNKTPFSIEQQEYIINYLSYLNIKFNETKNIYNLYINVKYSGRSEVLFFLDKIKTINPDYKKIVYYSGYENTLYNKRESFDDGDDTSNVIDICLICQHMWCYKYNVCSSNCLKKIEYLIENFLNYMNTKNYLFKELTNLIQKMLQKPIIKNIKFLQM